MIGEHLEKYDYKYMKDMALGLIDEKYDKRDNSIISDTLSPASYQLAEFFMELRNAYLNSSIYTAYGSYLDDKVIEQGIVRYSATKAIKKGTFEFEGNSNKLVPIGARFSTIDTNELLIYKVIENINANECLLECETEGIIGNSYVGDLLPVDYINNLTVSKITSLVQSARDIEDDESLRQRYFDSLINKKFAGNIQYYIDELKELDGIGAVQVYPVWNGGGTVKCSIVDNELNPVSSDFIDKIQNIVDPENSNGDRGQGLGIAPIGHKVTISTATDITLNISANVDLEPGYILSNLKPDITKELKNYIDTVKNLWGIADQLNEHNVKAYISKITASILNVKGIANVTDVKINNSNNDLVFVQDSTKQEMPKLGDVNLNG